MSFGLVGNFPIVALMFAMGIQTCTRAGTSINAGAAPLIAKRALTISLNSVISAVAFARSVRMSRAAGVNSGNVTGVNKCVRFSPYFAPELIGPCLSTPVAITGCCPKMTVAALCVKLMIVCINGSYACCTY
ncbi:hypothetical protein FKM82_011165 [Ascaphus truei]